MLKEFKVYYGNVPATQEQLDAIEEIIVEQEIGNVWEARISIPICVREDGSWDGEDDPAYKELARVRVEARIGEGAFVPLIDGRITTQDPGMSSEPGRSKLTLTVHDDTTRIHQMTASDDFPPGQSDSDIARSIFTKAALGGSIEVETVAAPTNPNVKVQQHGTPMQLLRAIMKRHRDYYAYVLPGSARGTSDCFFKKLPEEPDPSLPELVLTGPDKNISQFNIQRESNRAASFEAASIDLDGKTISTASSSSAEAEPPKGEAATQASVSDIRQRRLRPGIADQADLSEAAKGAAANSSLTVGASGSVLPECYGAILTPYRMLPAKVSNSRYSANYVIFKVVHTLGLSEYTQSFTVRGNAVSPKKSVSASTPSPAAVVAVSFNAQVDIF